MIDPEVTIQLDEPRRVYQPGELLAGSVTMNTLSFTEPRTAELSVLWYTEGQGDEDLAVLYFERLSKDDGTLGDARHPHRFQAVLPNSPLSYEGVLVKLFWCVRVRLFLARGKDIVVEEAFRLGNVPAVYSPSLAESPPAGAPSP